MAKGDPKVAYIGDTHIGKKFKTGVPLNRLGEREELIFKKFEEQLNQDADIIVHLGDLFDRPVVSYDDLYRTIKIIEEAWRKHPNKHFFFIEGNHDLSHDMEKVSAFDIAAKILEVHGNIQFFSRKPGMYSMGNVYLAFVPYRCNPDMNSGALFNPDAQANRKEITLCGHFDEPFNHNLFSQFKEVHTGHIHVPRVENNVVVQGSIIPMNFAEDPEGKLYRTMTLEEFMLEMEEDPNAEWQDQCIRLKLKLDEVLPEGINCRQLISMAEDAAEEEKVEEVSFEDFNIENLFHEALDDLGMFDTFYNRYLTAKLEQGI